MAVGKAVATGAGRAGKALTQKSTWNLIAIATLAVIGYLILKNAGSVIRKFFVGVGDLFNTQPDKLVEETATNDGTDMTPNEIADFKRTAKQIADTQETNLNITNFFGVQDANEEALFNSLIHLNGAQLQQVYAEYGVRGGMDLFQAYANELDDSFFTGMDTFGFGYWDDRVPGCNWDWLVNCNEAEFMRGIWQKSGLPVSF